MIGDAEYRAIGLVAAQWAYLEIQFDLCLYLVLAQPGVEKIRPPRVPQSFKARSDLLRDAARIVWAEHPDIRDRLIQIVNDATSLRTHRDRVIHGEWSLHRIGGRLGTKIRSITWRPAFKREEIPLDAEDVEEIADKISHVGAKLMTFISRVTPD